MRTPVLGAALMALMVAAPWRVEAARSPDDDLAELGALRSRLDTGDVYEAGAVPGLALDADQRGWSVGAWNLEDRPASCQVTLFADDRVVGSFGLALAAGELRRRDAAAAIPGGEPPTYAQVSCDRTFHPVATANAAAAGDDAVILAKAIGPNGPCREKVTLTRRDDGKYVVDRIGLFHQATTAAPKGILCVRAPSPLRVARAVFEWDFLVGPWSPRDRSGVHNLAYFFLDRYRSGVIGNVNAIGPKKDQIKWMQNYSMPPCETGLTCRTIAQRGHRFQADAVYHVIYVFDAAAKRATVTLQDSGRTTLATASGDIQPANSTLLVSPYGKGDLAGLAMVVEFGNYLGQLKPEEATVGWLYGNLHVEMTTY